MKKKKLIVNIFIVIFILLMIYSVVNIVLWYIGRNRNETITKEIIFNSNNSVIQKVSNSIIL